MNRSGPFSKKDKEYIRKNVDTTSLEEMARYLERNVNTIKKFVEDNKLGASFQLAEGSPDISQGTILAELRAKPFYKVICKQFSQEEVNYFAEYWVMIHSDFGGNIMAHEELELKEWLTFETLKNRELINQSVNTVKKESLQEELEEEFRNPPDSRDKDRIKYLSGQIHGISESLEKHSKDFATLADKADKIKKGLTASREARTKDMDMAKLDYSAYIKILNTQFANRKRVGEEMEILRLAEKKKREEMFEYHEYSDGHVDLPILTADSVELLEKEEK